MKLEKREITLNEYDSLRDMFFMEKILLNEYNFFLAAAQRKESRSELSRLMKEAGEDMAFLKDLMSGSAIENEE